MMQSWCEGFGRSLLGTVFSLISVERRGGNRSWTRERHGTRGVFPAARTCPENGKEEPGTVPGPEPPHHGGLSRTALPWPWSAAPRPTGPACGTAPSCR